MSNTIQEVDLCSVTRDANRIRTRVLLCLDAYSQPVPWLVFGRANLRENSRLRTWQLQAMLNKGATDWHHDSAFALRLPLVGVAFLGVEGGHVRLDARVDADAEPIDFRVPLPGYKPFQGAIRCKECKPSHLFVAEGHYAGPPFNEELYRTVAGKRVEIRISPHDP